MPGWMHSGMQSHAPMAARPAAPPLHPCRRLARNGSAPFAPATTHCSAGHGGRRAASIVQLQALPGMLAASPLLATLPPSVLTDSYKATHFLQYPDATEMVAYGEFRKGFGGDKSDTRLVVWGVRYVIENYVARRWTEADVEAADAFYSTYLAPRQSAHPFPRDLFLKFVTENDGWFPVTIQALPEGTCTHVHVPVYQITARDEYMSLCTFLETLLTMIWYPCCVATLSRRTRDVIEAGFARSADGGAGHPLVSSRLHDFGFRGCTCVEQSVIGGAAHLLNFDGSDTMSAAYYVQFALNGGRPVGMSIPATEHSVMTSWPDERAAILNMVARFGDGVFACVMDSYDYAAALSEVLPSIASEQVAAGGFMVLRPDSGDPVEVVLMALHACERVFGADTNERGYKVLRGVGVIQGDGINMSTIAAILDAAIAAGYSAENVAFGMGGGLLQKVHRDTMSFATKLCHMAYADGGARDVMKAPATDSTKTSLPGRLAVKRVEGVPTAFPAGHPEVGPGEDLLETVWDKGPVAGHEWESFDAVRARVRKEWGALPKTADVISRPLRAKVSATLARMGKSSQGQEELAAAAQVGVAAGVANGNGAAKS